MTQGLNEIKSHDPCAEGWALLLKNLGKTKSDDEPIDLITILESNGIEDAVWAIRCFDAIDTCLFNADVAGSVLHIFEANNDSQAPLLAIQAVRDFKAGKLTREEVLEAAEAAADVAVTVESAVCTAVNAAAHAAADAAAVDIAHSDTSAAAVHAATYATSANPHNDVSKEKWNETK